MPTLTFIIVKEEIQSPGPSDIPIPSPEFTVAGSSGWEQKNRSWWSWAEDNNS